MINPGFDGLDLNLPAVLRGTSWLRFRGVLAISLVKEGSCKSDRKNIWYPHGKRHRDTLLMLKQYSLTAFDPAQMKKSAS